ncbi:MAG TPA: hypothetical protein VHO25_11850, partial [Polyangiaceae bacterium]|nr:hypothetical protein [Polyangiaceae bacterium]
MTTSRATGPSITQQRLRELAPRARQVVEQHKELHPGIAEAATTVEPAAAAFIKVYDDAVEFHTAQSREMEQGKESLAVLEREIRSCLAIVYHRLPGADVNELDGTVETPNRLISDGYKVLTLLTQAEVSQGEALKARLEAALKAAEAQWSKAQEARMVLQQRQATVREHAIQLNKELVTLRRLLHVVVGTHHLAYQTLRTSRVSGPVDENEEDTVVEEEVFETPAHPAGVSNGSAKANTPAPAFASGTTV